MTQQSVLRRDRKHKHDGMKSTECRRTYNIEADKFGNVLDLNPRKWLNDSAKILLQKIVVERLQM